jgi:hypothetical protein
MTGPRQTHPNYRKNDIRPYAKASFLMDDLQTCVRPTLASNDLGTLRRR